MSQLSENNEVVMSENNEVITSKNNGNSDAASYTHLTLPTNREV